MNCKEFESVVLGLDRGEGPGDLALGHAARCANCQATLENIQGLRASLTALAAQDELTEAPRRVEAALLKTFRGGQPASLDLPAIGFARVPRFRLALAAAAALIVIAIASIIYTRSIDRTRTVADRKPEASAPANASDLKKDTNESLPNHAVPAPDQNRKAQHEDRQKRDGEGELATFRGPARNRPVNRRGGTGPERTEGYEIATDYFPINLGSYLQPLDGGRVLRIKLPRSALMNYGLPVDPLRADEAVNADVVIGNDGMARAIRFVH